MSVRVHRMDCEVEKGLSSTHYVTAKLSYLILNRLVAGLLLVLAAPLTCFLVVLVRVLSPGPGLFRQLRVGQGGRIYTMYKIRTMRMDAEVSSGPIWATVRDPRVTGLGRLLRKLHLDELPQLWNVLCGDMSLVGPRPERPEFVQRLAIEIPNYLDRLTVLPGITGLAQINLPPDTDIDSVRKKLLLDMEYLRQRGIFLDIRIISCTAFRLVGIHGYYTRRILGLERRPGNMLAQPAPTSNLRAAQKKDLYNGPAELARDSNSSLDLSTPAVFESV